LNIDNKIPLLGGLPIWRTAVPRSWVGFVDAINAHNNKMVFSTGIVF